MKKTTLKEIAKTLNLSIATVSKSLKDYPDVSQKTKKKVLAYAEKVGFTPNIFAQSLKGKATKTIGVIIPNMVHYFFSSVLDAILKEAEKRNYLVITLQTNENLQLETKQVELLLNKSVDGIIMSLCNLSDSNLSHLKKIIDYNTPLVLFDKITKFIDCSKVVIDDIKASYDAVSYLIKSGYKRIAYFRGDLNPQNSIDRFTGYKKALREHNVEFDPNLIFLTPNADFENGYQNAKLLFENTQVKVDAIYAITDLSAIGAITYLNEKQIKIPDEVAVFGFSNWFMSSVITPKLSTLDQNASKMGTATAKILFEEIEAKFNKKSIKHKKVIIDTEMIIREST